MKTMKVMLAVAVCSLAATAFAYDETQNVMVTQDPHGNPRVVYTPQQNGETVALFASGHSVARESWLTNRDVTAHVVQNAHGQQELRYMAAE